MKDNRRYIVRFYSVNQDTLWAEYCDSRAKMREVLKRATDQANLPEAYADLLKAIRQYKGLCSYTDQWHDCTVEVETKQVDGLRYI